MRTPDIIFLNGTSSSGKTTLAHALQRQLSTVYLHVPVDSFGVMFPQSKLGDAELCASATPKLLAGFYRSIAALVDCGNSVIADTVAPAPHSEVFEPLFANFDVVYVAVRCPLEELERRESARGDRNIGLARSQFFEIHRALRYDIEVETHQNNAEQCAALIKRFIEFREF